MPSNLVFTPPLGLQPFAIKKTPSFSTITKTAASGRSLRQPLYQWPIWEWDLPFGYLKGHESRTSAYQYLLGFYLQMQGSYQSFLFQDQHDSTCSQNGQAGTTLGCLATQSGAYAIGDGATTTFQLIRQIAGGYDIVQNPAGTITPFINGAPQVSGFTVGYAGTITFTTAPASGAILAWSGAFFHRVHFKEDTMDQLQMLMSEIWDLSSLKLETVLL